MLVSKRMMELIKSVGKDKNMPFLSMLHITKKGETVVANGKSILVCEPLPQEIKDGCPFGEGEPTEAFSISLETVEQVLRVVPVDKQFGGALELIRIDVNDTDAEIHLHDGKREKDIKTQVNIDPWFQFKELIRKIFTPAKVVASVTIDMDRFIATLLTLQKVSGDSPLYLDFTDEGDIFVRSIITTTGQRIAGVVTGVQSEFLQHSDFEKSLYTEAAKKILKKQVQPVIKKKVVID